MHSLLILILCFNHETYCIHTYNFLKFIFILNEKIYENEQCHVLILKKQDIDKNKIYEQLNGTHGHGSSSWETNRDALDKKRYIIF